MENGDSADCGVGAIVKHIDRKTSPETAWRNGRGGGRETFISRETSFAEIASPEKDSPGEGVLN